MKTFDIAKKYLEDINFSKFDLNRKAYQPLSEEEQSILKQCQYLSLKFLKDAENKASNDYYRKMVFEACIHHLIQLSHNYESYWDKACEIIEFNKATLNTDYILYKGMNYPELMFDKFIGYCDKLNPQPHFLSKESELRDEFFMLAYHYKIDQNS